MTTLGDFKTILRTRIGRGNSLDAELQDFVRLATKYIERRQSFQYMYHFNLFQTDPESVYPRTIRLEKDIKTIDFMRFAIGSDFHYLTQIQAREATAVGEVMPFAFWRVQGNLVILNTKPTEKWNVEIGWWEYTDISPDDSYKFWLLDNFEDGLLEACLIQAGVRLRDKAMIAEHSSLFNDMFDTLIMAEEEATRSTTSLSMGGYLGPIY